MSADANSQRPRHFPAAPDVRRYFPAACMESARERLVRAVARQEGPAIVCGPAGVGKTMLLDVLAEHFARQMEVARIIGGQIDSRRSLLQLVLFHVGLPYQGLEEAELRISLLTRLQRPTNPDASAIVPPRLLLLIDEADRLPSDVFEELRGLANLADGGASLVQLVLFGGAALEEQLAEPELGAFSQRLSARCYLSPMNREETHQYVRSHVAAVGDDPDELLTTGALDALYSATGGVPRLVSQLGDQLLWLADREPGAALTAAAVQQVWSDLQQLPTPWELQKSAACPEPSEAGGDVIEFGTLDESSAEEGSLLTLEGEFCRHVETIDIQFADLRDLDQASPVDEVTIRRSPAKSSLRTAGRQRHDCRSVARRARSSSGRRLRYHD